MLNAIFFPKLPHSFSPFEALWIPEILQELWIKKVYDSVFGEKINMVVIDGGSNVGLATQYFYDHCKQIYAIEPSPENYEALAKNKEFNEWDKVKLYNAALSDKDGEAEIHFNTGNRTANSITSNWGHGGTSVKTITLKTLFKENKIDEVDFLKMDIEGAESMVLSDPSFKEVAPKIKALMVEFHNGDHVSLVEYIKSLGFEARQESVDTVNYLFTRV
jgi:FkbM family methyltransferase